MYASVVIMYTSILKLLMKTCNVCMLDDDDMKYELPKNNYDIRFRNTQNEINHYFVYILISNPFYFLTHKKMKLVKL